MNDSGSIRPSLDRIPAEASRQLFHSASLPLLALDGEGRVLFSTPHVHEVLGISSGALDGEGLRAGLSGRDLAVFENHLEQIFTYRVSARGEMEWCSPDGTARSLRLISLPEKAPDGRLVCWSTVENLTRARQLEKTEMFYRRLTEAALTAQSLAEFSSRYFELLRMIFDIRAGFVAVLNRQTGRIDYPGMNGPAADPTAQGSAEDDLVRFILSSGRPLWWSEFPASGQGMGPDIKFSGTSPSDLIGLPFNTKQSSSGIVAVWKDQPGRRFTSWEMEMLMGSVRILELYLAGMKNLETGHQLSAAIEQVTEVVMITDVRGVIEYVNSAFEQITGYSRSEAIGRTTALLRSGRHERSFYKDLWSTLRAGNTWRGRFVNRRKDGGLYEEDAVICPVRNARQEITHFVAVKRVAGKEPAGESRHRSDWLAEEALGRLSASLGHDFRNIVMTLHDNAEILRRSYAVGDETEDALVQMLQASLMAERLLKQWTLLTSKGGLPEVINLNMRLIEFEPMAARVLGENRSLTLDLSPRADPVFAAPGEIEQTLASLLLKIRDTMPENAALVLRTYPLRATEIDSSGLLMPLPAGKQFFVVLELSGPGVAGDAAHFSADIEDPSWPPDLERRLVKMGGSISARRISPHGPMIRLYFPTRSPPAAVPTHVPDEAPTGGHETILIAEDDPGARRVMARMLQDGGYNILEAENGAMAIRALLYHEGTVDLLLTDIMMPDFDGRTLANQIAGMKPGIKVLFASGYDVSELQARDIVPPGGSLELVKKPFRREELLSAVRRALDSE